MEARPRRVRAAAASLATFLLLLGVSVAFAASQGPGGLEGRYIVILQDSTEHPGAVGREHVDRNGGHLGFVYRHGPIGYSATLPGSAVDALERDPQVREVRVDHMDFATAQTTPTGIKRVFASTNKALMIDGKENYAINADVAVIDTGIDFEHPDLFVFKRTYCNGTEMSAKCTDNTGTDEDEHGTHVAGTIAAIDNGEGVVGVAPSARLWSVKVLDPGAWESEIVAGINWVTERAGEIEVANMSLGCKTLPCERKTVKEAVTKSIEAGVVYVISAGNESANASESAYATIPVSITVSAIADYDGVPGGETAAFWTPGCKAELQNEEEEKVGADDTSATFSNWGKDIEIAAPGVCIYSTFEGKGYLYDSGTSMAAPHVSGAAAILAAQKNPNSKADVETIRNTIVNAGNKNWKDTSGDGIQEKLLDVSNETLFK